MENLFVIAIPTRKRARRNLLLLLKRDHGSEIMMQEMYEWYIYALGDVVDGEAAQGGRDSLSLVLEAVASSGTTDSPLSTWDRPDVDPMDVLHQRLFNTDGTNRPGGKMRLGFQMLDFGLNVGQVVFVWNPAVSAAITNAKWLSLGAKEALDV